MNYYEKIPNPNVGTAGYICQLCGTVAPSEIKIIHHLQRRHKQENLKLKIISPSSSALNNNKLKMQLERDKSDGEMTKKNAITPLTEEDVFFPCDHCEDIFRLRRELFHHIEEEHNIFPCESCGEKFKLRMEKRKHRCPSQIGKQSAGVSRKEEETNEADVVSNSIAPQFVVQSPKRIPDRTKSNVIITSSSGHRVGASNAPKWFEGAKYECSICSCIHHDPNSFRGHLRKVHNATNPVVKDYEVETAGPYTCKICGSILKRYRSNIESHIIRHTGSSRLMGHHLVITIFLSWGLFGLHQAQD